MYIYIDESGIFSNPHNKLHIVSCVASLIITEKQKEIVFGAYEKIRAKWGHNQEIKGSKLNEEQIKSVLKILNDHDVIAEICAIDMGFYKDEEVTQFKKVQADKFTENITSLHHPNVLVELKKLANTLRETSNQLFVQALVSTELVYSTLQVSTLYLSRKNPQELQYFHWVIDAKSQKRTRYEELWHQVVMPFLQSKSLQEPFIQAEKLDYSYFQRFCSSLDRPPDYLRPFVKDPNKKFDTIDIKKIMQESLVFKDSKNEIGLQLVDIIASSFSRAIKGNLQLDGWIGLGNLLFYKMKRAIQFIGIPNSSEAKGIITHKVPYASVLDRIIKVSKKLFD